MDKILTREIVVPIVVIALSIIFYNIIRKVVKKVFLHHRQGDIKKHKTIVSLVNNILKYFFVAIDIVIILDVYGIDTKAIIASLGLGVAVLGLALQDLIKDLIAGIFIVFEGQFSVGDTITIGDFRGEVISLGLKTTKLKSFTGEVKIISNRLITEVINYNMSSNIAIVDVSVSYDSDLNKVNEVLNDFCIKMTSKLKATLEGDVKLLGVEKLDSSEIIYRITAPCKSMTQFDMQRILREEVVLELRQNNITIPYPQVVVHHE